MLDFESDQKIPSLDTAAEPGVIAPKYQENDMVTRENLMAFIIWTFFQARGSIDRQTQALALSMAHGVISLEALEAIVSKTYQPIEEELSLAQKTYVSVEKHRPAGFEDNQFVWNEMYHQLALAIDRLKK